MRKPIARGFYFFDRDLLIKQIEDCFLDEFGPGYIPKERKKNRSLIAGIVPHAGYSFSGPAAAFLYKELYENWDFDTIVILGTNHTGLGSYYSMLVSEDWETPLGVIKTDKEFGMKLIEEFDIYEEKEAHFYEHSIEVQLPFLYYLFDGSFRLVPIVISDLNLERVRRFVKTLRDVSNELGRKVFLISSSDLTHHGSYYGYKKFDTDIPEKVRELDMKYIDRIINLDSEGLLDLFERENGTVCGISPIIAFIEYTKLEKGKVELLKYYNSGEKTGEEDFVVGYASILSFI
ncbi:AmmeMemoRadiSam system protein B [Nanoarchaeota archaeon NZ13-N]|uniref:MEMO1 family protein BXU00_00695 n=1 Tax=Candidatus Nanoclepta minutus TaxID=1940235 RepID=A0A397WNH3_9ARCH|nr:MAG: AmmeMemoRadiSam system protein B [Nanoarchaeota archaeon NZ13-N]RIB35608.1 MAG: AmmeMemoRadiSam system protein B [Candidatus Nanoclepta minutus]